MKKLVPRIVSLVLAYSVANSPCAAALPLTREGCSPLNQSRRECFQNQALAPHLVVAIRNKGDKEYRAYQTRLAIRFRLRRQALGWTQKQLAEKSGIFQSRISHLEDPSREGYLGGRIDLAKALKLPLQFLFSRSDELHYHGEDHTREVDLGTIGKRLWMRAQMNPFFGKGKRSGNIGRKEAAMIRFIRKLKKRGEVMNRAFYDYAVREMKCDLHELFAAHSDLDQAAESGRFTPYTKEESTLYRVLTNHGSTEAEKESTAAFKHLKTDYPLLAEILFKYIVQDLSLEAIGIFLKPGNPIHRDAVRTLKNQAVRLLEGKVSGTITPRSGSNQAS